jgi:hypothetical protein
VTDLPSGGLQSFKLEHLSCFLPGLFSLGIYTLQHSPSLLGEDALKLQRWAAEGLGTTCWLTYADHVTGLGPDEVMFTRWSSPKKEASEKPSKLSKWRVSDKRQKSLASPNAILQGRWSHVLKEWVQEREQIAQQAQGDNWFGRTQTEGFSWAEYKDFPPGVRNGVPLTGEGFEKKDYWLRKPNYELRPEVRPTLSRECHPR